MHWFYKALHSVSAIGDVAIVKLFSNICGGFFIYTVLNIGDALGRTKFEKAAIVMLYVSFGTIQHFCGYVEVYALTAVVLAVYFYTGILCLRGKLPWLIPVTVFFLGALCHLITIMFFPSLLYILYAVELKKYRLFRNPLLWILGFAVCIAAAWPLIVNRIVPELYPLSSQTGDIITLFSLRHFCEYCNGIVLGCGFLLVITVACAAYAWHVRLKLNSEHWFFIVASASIATCIFLFRGILGSSDWDTLSFAALAINLLGILLLFSLFKEEKYRLFLRYACVVIIGLMVLESAVWVVLNRGDRSIQRFENAIMTDPGFYYVGHPSPMYVSIVLNNNNLKDEAMKFYKLAYEQYPDDPRCGFNYIMALCIRKQPEQANAVLAELTKRSPDYAAQRMRIMFTVAQNEHQELFTTLALKQYYLEYCKTPDIINAYFTHEETINNFKSLVELLMQKNDFFNAEPVVNTILKLEPGNGINYFMLAKIVYGERKYDRTIDICNYIITSIPNIPLPYQLKANALVLKHKNDMAAETLRKGLAAVKEKAQKRDLQASLDSLLMGKTDMKN